jgi:tRNA G10  N-methylase Trm11
VSQAGFSFVNQQETIARLEARPGPEDDLSSLESLKNVPEVMRRLSSVDWAFTEAKTSYLSHDIHPYPAKFIPQIPRNVIAQLSVRGELVWDPFGGCGTTALEAILLGRCALSTDVNPLGEIIGEAKTLTLTKEEEEVVNDFSEQLLLLSTKPSHVLDQLRQGKEQIRQFIPVVPNLEEWFHDTAIAELAYLRWRIDSLKEPKAVVLAKVAFSKSILKASFQDGETRYARKPREIDTGSILSLFATNLSNALRKVKQLGSLLKFREAEFKTIDLRVAPTIQIGSDKKQTIIENSVDLIVTSPPYPNTTDYHLYHRFRLFWLGFDPRDLARKEIGSHLRHQKEKTGFEAYLLEMSQCLETMKATLRPGRYAVLVVGSGVFKGEVYDSASYISRAAKKLGFQVVGTIDREVHLTKRSFISVARRLKAETILVLRKPDCKFELTLLKPPYKLWPYEDSLRRKEIETLTRKIPRDAGDGNLSVQTSALSIDCVRRLTFTHGFWAKEISKNPTWQATLENGDAITAGSSRKDPKYATHGIHSYKGKFYPQLAKSLFNLGGLVPGQTVLDPFCGSGTVLLESYLNGLRGVGTDINILAVKIARVKTEILEVDPYLRDRILSRFQDRLETFQTAESMISFFPESSREELLSWFPRLVLEKLAILLDNIERVSEPSVRELLEILTSSIVRDISHQDPKDLRIRRRHEPLEDAPVFQLFRQRLVELRRRLQQFSERAKSAPHLFQRANAILGDSRSADAFKEHHIDLDSVDAIVTSPPYATALPYIDTDRLSILLLFGLTSRKRAALEESLIGTREISKKDKASLERDIDTGNFDSIFSKTARSIILEVRKRNAESDAGFRRQNMAALLFLYFRDMSVVMSNVSPLLRKGASAFFVIGNTRTTARGKVVEIKSADVLQEIGIALGWKVADVIPITVTTENRRHSKNSITKNSIIWFKKVRG